MVRQSLDLVGVMILASLVLLFAILGVESTWLRSLLALPLALYGVGYALGAALFPLRWFESTERFLLSLGLSLFTLILTGLLLHGLRVEMSPVSWAVSLFLISATAAARAGFVRWQANSRPDWVPGSQTNDLTVPLRWPTLANRQVNPLQVLMLSLAVMLVILSTGLAFQPAPQSAYQGYTMLWIAPIQLKDVEVAEVGVRSMEFDHLTYHIDLYAGGELVKQWNEIQLGPKQAWTVRLDLHQYPHNRAPLEAYLYRSDSPHLPYRQVRLWPSTAVLSSMDEAR